MYRFKFTYHINTGILYHQTSRNSNSGKFLHIANMIKERIKLTNKNYEYLKKEWNIYGWFWLMPLKVSNQWLR